MKKLLFTFKNVLTSCCIINSTSAEHSWFNGINAFIKFNNFITAERLSCIASRVNHSLCI